MLSQPPAVYQRQAEVHIPWDWTRQTWNGDCTKSLANNVGDEVALLSLLCHFDRKGNNVEEGPR
jgi:hypothetical protein